MPAGLQGSLDAAPLLRGIQFLAADCKTCGGHAVPGEGSAHPLTFFVGEAPGPQEEMQGRPFVGRAGKLLRACLVEAAWNAETIWITNIVKCFPYTVEAGKKRIRKPTPEEVQGCLPHLLAEIDGLKPKLLVALGKTAAEALLGRRVEKLGDLRGTLQRGRPELGSVPVFVTHHPSALFYGKLRGQRDEFVEDLRTARTHLVPTRT